MRTVSINSHYFFLAKNPCDATTVSNLAKQMFPGKTRYVVESFGDATSDPYSFCLIDVTQQTDDDKRIIGNYALEDKPMVIYSPR